MADIQRIAQLSVRVRKIDRAVRFYGDVLGLPVLYANGNMALVDCAGVRLLLGVPESPQFDHPSSVVYFQVADLPQSVRKLAAEGVEFEGEPHKVAEFGGNAVWMAFFYDPDRNLHALTSEVPLSPES